MAEAIISNSENGRVSFLARPFLWLAPHYLYLMRMWSAMQGMGFGKINSASPIIYSAKCLLGLCIGYELYRRFPQYQFVWSMISILIVLAPDGGDSNKLAFERVVSNLLGSIVGLLIFLIHEPNLFLICLGATLTILLGTWFKLSTTIRSALVSLVIVMIGEQQNNSWKIPLERIGCVVVGCFIAMLITLTFNFFLQPKSAQSGAIAE